MKESERQIEENQKLQKQLAAFQDLHDLQKESYFRQQLLLLMERLVTIGEKQAEAMEELSTEEQDL